MAQLRILTSGAVTGTGTIDVPSKIFGGYRLNTDGTNAGTLIIRDKDASGKILVDVSSITTVPEFAPFECSGTVYYSIAGTGADCQLYEWVLKLS